MFVKELHIYGRCLSDAARVYDADMRKYLWRHLERWRSGDAAACLLLCVVARSVCYTPGPDAALSMTQLVRLMLVPYVYDTGRNSWRRACTRMVSITLADAVITATTTSGLTAIVINHNRLHEKGLMDKTYMDYLLQHYSLCLVSDLILIGCSHRNVYTVL